MSVGVINELFTLKLNGPANEIVVFDEGAQASF